MLITTKYIGPTNYRPGRVKAQMRQPNGVTLSITRERDHELSVTDNHKGAMPALVEKWDGDNAKFRDCRATSWAAHYGADGGYVFITLCPSEIFEA